MGIIPCDLNCKYQKEGYCTLESIEKVTNSIVAQGCAHYIDAKKPIYKNDNELDN